MITFVHILYSSSMIMSVHLSLLMHVPSFFRILQHPRRLSSDTGDTGFGLFRQPGQLSLELSGQSTEDDPVLKFVRPWEPVGGSGKLQLLQKKFPHFLFVHERTQAAAAVYAAGDKLSALTFGRCAYLAHCPVGSGGNERGKCAAGRVSALHFPAEGKFFFAKERPAVL